MTIKKVELDTSNHAEFDGAGSGLPCTATTPNRAPKAIKLQLLIGGKLESSGGCGWSEIEDLT